MRFRLIGVKEETGETVNGEIEASSVDSLERRAARSGITVISIEPLSPEPESEAHFQEVLDEVSESSDDPLLALQAAAQSTQPPTPGVPPASSRFTRKVKEMRATCSACGHVWHYKWGEEFQKKMDNFSTESSKLGCNLMTCGCLNAFMQPKRTIPVGRCPKCGSSAISRETVTHEIPMKGG
jgi:predicted RNA-binding Zn-ribbon protein involved in translation (DUF1610 family)